MPGRENPAGHRAYGRAYGGPRRPACAQGVRTGPAYGTHGPTDPRAYAVAERYLRTARLRKTTMISSDQRMDAAIGCCIGQASGTG